MQSSQSQSTPEPFSIIYNFRSRTTDRERPQRKVSACERQPPLEFTIRTRKMTAEIELHLQSQPTPHIDNEEELPICEEPPMKDQEFEGFFLNNEQDLQNAIPLDNSAGEQPFDLQENSRASSYCKLDALLFDLRGQEAIDEEE